MNDSGLENELLGNDLGTIDVNGTEMDIASIDPVFGEQIDLTAPINWEDSYEVAAAQLGVSEEEWQTFIDGVNDVKARSAEFQASRAFQDMQMLRDRRVLNLMTNNPDMTEEEAIAEVEGSEWYQDLMANQEGYTDLNAELNALYESVGLDPSGSIMGGTKGESASAFLTFDPVTGSLTHNNKSNALRDFAKMAVLGAAGLVAGPAIASSLGGILGPAAAKAASSAIWSMASQYMASGEMDLGQALLSAAISYGGAELGEALEGSGVLGEIGGKVDGITEKFNNLIDTGSSVADAAIKAGGMSMLTQFVTTGEVDIKEAALAAVMAGGGEAFSKFKIEMEAAGVAEDEYMADLAEMEEFQQAAMDADIKDPFLNPNYETVGDGLLVNASGEVFNYDGESMGTMNDLDVDGDGMLSGNDLQYVEVTATKVNETPFGPDDYYDVDGDGQYTEGVDRLLTAPTTTTTPDAFTNEWADNRYAGMGRNAIIDQMQRDGFSDATIDNYIEHWDATNDLNLQELNTRTFGAIDVNMEDPYTIGQTEEGTYYIAKTDADTGEVSFKSISEEQYNELYGKMYGTDKGAGAISTGDYSDVENYLETTGIADGGTIADNDPTNPQYGINDAGQRINPLTGETIDDWVTLYEGSSNNAVQVDINSTTQDAEPVDPQPTDPNEATGDPNQSTAPSAGQGGTDSTDTTAVTGSGVPGVSGGTPGGSSGGGPGAGGMLGGGVVVPPAATGGPVGGGTVDTTDTTGDTTPTVGTTPMSPYEQRIAELMERGMSREQAEANQAAAIAAGADANEDGAVTDQEWKEATGAGASTGGGATDSSGTGTTDTTGTGSQSGTDSGAETGTGTSTGTETGTGTEGTSGGTEGTTDTTGGGETTGGGTQTGTGGEGVVGGGVGPDSGPGTGTTPGPGTGPTPGPGTGTGGGGEGDGGGMLSGGGDYTPQWGQLFAYTTLTPYQKEAVAPYVDYIEKARGMMS